MKIRNLAAIAAALLLPLAAMSQNLPQKREMRSAWVATVWQLDWPSVTLSETGNQKQIERQKQQMTTLLDSLSVNNFNAINFQVRSRCDAMYRSSYEPWSSDLVKTRGMDPGWDPLQWVVEECHKRGLECHAWLNPYRYESVIGQWNDDPTCYRKTHPEWLLDVGTASILNPGLPEVTQRICDIIKEITANYDIDGVLFDDYFYLSGTKESHDGELYNAYKQAGGKLSIGDWRRENVNQMIASVYSTIKETKPWVRFGVSPAGIACTSATVANKYGIPRCPTGSDWQYNDIYSDPIAWVSRQTLDFISPQVYWTLGYSTNYGLATEWWSMVANKWQRHLYVSHSISSLTLSSHAPGMSGVETALQPKATGPGNTTYAEYANEVLANRQYDLNGAPGSIFYSAKYIYQQSPKFGHYLRNHVFNTKALVPAVTWQSAPAAGLVENLERSGSKLSWKAMENMRYTVYAFPEEIPVANFMREPEYLLGVSYASEFTLPAGALAGFRYAVCALDRYGNEYSPALVGVSSEPLAAPVGVSPIGGITAEAPFAFEWSTVEGATEYIVEIATDPEMKQRFDQRSTSATSISSEDFFTLPTFTLLYWRVRSCGAGKADGVSDIYSFQASNLLITSPASGSTGVSLTPTFENSIPEREVVLEISDTEAFNANDIVYTLAGKGALTVEPRHLMAATAYYARLNYTHNGIEKSSPIVQFTTVEMEPVVPTVATPVAGGTLHANEHVTLAGADGAGLLRVEISASATFPPRTSYITTRIDRITMADPKAASEIKLGSKSLVDGETYYIRSQSSYRTVDGDVKASEFSQPQTFVYNSQAGMNDVNAASGYITVANATVTVLAEGVADIKVYDAAGALVATLAKAPKTGDILSLDGLATGVYFVKATTAKGEAEVLKTVKL